MIEFLGAAPKKEVLEALARLKKITAFLAIIGSYPVRRV
jgi:prephenate dehydratase